MKGLSLRDFDYGASAKALLTPRIVSLLTELHEHKVRMQVFANTRPEQVEKLLDLAKVQSIDASNRIEGIFTSDSRLKAIAMNKSKPRSRNEEEIAGYRDVLAIIHESNEFIPVSPNIIVQFHRDLYKYTACSHGGRFKDSDNAIAEITLGGESFIRFAPVSAVATPGALEAICEALNKAKKDDQVDSLLLSCLFILDFLCIHPFTDGNGRMSRLLTLLLFYQAGYEVGRYVSIEKIIERSKESYYEVLREDSRGWHEGDNDYEELTAYYLGVLIAAYRSFGELSSILVSAKLSKSKAVRQTIEATIGKFTKSQLIEGIPNVSERTIEVVLLDMLKEGRIEKIGGGRYTAYTLKPKNE
jgi:Fic family protein